MTEGNHMQTLNMQDSESAYNRSIYTALRIGFVALLFVWSFLIIQPFILPTLWGIIIAVAIFPLFERLSARIGNRRKTAAALITILGLTLLIVPSIVFIDSAVDGIQNLSTRMETGSVTIPPPSEDVATWPVIGKPVYDVWSLASSNLKKAIMQFEPQLRGLAPKLLSAASGLSTTLLLFIISTLIAGALLTKDKASEKAARSIFTTLIGAQGEHFVGHSVATIRSVVQGVLGVAVIQSLMGGVGIWAIGIPVAGLWALIILFMAILQLPPLLILGPLAIYVFTIAETTPAVLFLIWSTLVSVSDAFLKPMLLGRGVDVPMLAILLGAIGGMILYGILGLFVGAVVLTISYKTFKDLLVDDILDKERKESQPTMQTGF